MVHTGRQTDEHVGSMSKSDQGEVSVKKILPFQGWPLAEIWVLCGFFMIYIVEEVSWFLGPDSWFLGPSSWFLVPGA